jgi:3-hydroxyacyl-CoA dehydrogenase
MTEIRTVGVVGGGLMGSGIAQVAAVAGYRTVLREVDEGLATRARSAVERSPPTRATRRWRDWPAPRRWSRSPSAT